MHSKVIPIFLKGGVIMKHKNFFMVPNSIFELELKPWELAVYCCLLKYCDEDMTCYPSRSTIGKDCCIDECTVDNALGGLIQKGLVQKSARYYEDGARDSNLYTLASFIETV
jgi:predicted transcriptional regulator